MSNTQKLMARFSDGPDAFGKPGMEPRWTHANKDGVGTAYSADSKIWFTVWRGILTETYSQTIDLPQLRDLQFLFTDGKTFFVDEKTHTNSQIERIAPHALGYKITNTDTDGRFALKKEIICDPHLACVLQHVTLKYLDSSLADRLKTYVVCEPHLEAAGGRNNAYAIESSGRKILAAEKNGTWMVCSATVPFSRMSCGYAGTSDGVTDLANNFQMDWEFGRALDGNVALTGELDLKGSNEFTLGLAFGHTLNSAVTKLFQSLGVSFHEQKTRFIRQWDRAYRRIAPLDHKCVERSDMYRVSCALLLSHEDKSFPGAIVASLTIPWGEAVGDEDRGGYHLVWTRDLINSATALLAAGDTETPLHALIYLAASQQEDGGFPQNFWIDGRAYYNGMQLDEVAFPIMLAWLLFRASALKEFDPYEMVIRGAGYLIRHGPVTQQERWEEASGYSPSTLASNIAALICAADFARNRNDLPTAEYIEEYADYLESHVDKWTVTTEGTLDPDVKKHYIRITPADVNEPLATCDPNNSMLVIANQAPMTPSSFPAKEIVDTGFLELVRYGIRDPKDPLILDTLKVVDSVLKVETPFGPCWRRYNHDGYGQREDGGPYLGWGRGRAWPILTGERGHYELAAGNDVTPFIRALERFASPTGLLTEQVWDEKDRPDQHLYFGRPTGSAMPLMWSHAEYVKLLRSANDGKVFALNDGVKKRYITNRAKSARIEIWKPNYQVQEVEKGATLRIQAQTSFRLHWTSDDWKTTQDNDSTYMPLGAEYVDIQVSEAQSIRFTFFWLDTGKWEGKDYEVKTSD